MTSAVRDPGSGGTHGGAHGGAHGGTPEGASGRAPDRTPEGTPAGPDDGTRDEAPGRAPAGPDDGTHDEASRGAPGAARSGVRGGRGAAPGAHDAREGTPDAADTADTADDGTRTAAPGGTPGTVGAHGTARGGTPVGARAAPLCGADGATTPPPGAAHSGARGTPGTARGGTGFAAGSPASGGTGAGVGAGAVAVHRAARGEAVELLREQLAGRQLARCAALVAAVCVGVALLASATYERVHVGRLYGATADTSLVVGAVLVPAAGVLLVLTGRHSRARRRRLARLAALTADGAPLRPPRRARRRWLVTSWSACAAAGVFLAAGLHQAASSDPYDAPDPTLYGTFLVWTAILAAAGCAGIRRTRPPRPAALPADGRTPRTALYAGFRTEPAALTRLSARLDARTQRLSRTAAVLLATVATLLCCALTAAAALLPGVLGGGTGLFWCLVLAAGALLAVLLPELVRYGTRRRYGVLGALLGVALVVVTWYGFSTATLLARGSWIRAEVTAVHHPTRGAPYCDLRPLPGQRTADGTAGGLRLAPCRDFGTGDTPRVFHDPRGQAQARTREPLGMTGPVTAWACASAALVLCGVSAAVHGHRRRAQLGLTAQTRTRR